MNDPNRYENPLIERYASRQMAERWGDQRRYSTWRRLWIALAEAQQSLGLAISDEQLSQMRRAVDAIDFRAAADYEKRFRHDVMAHIHAFGDAAPAARPVLHLGATSCYVTDNTDLILIRESLEQIRQLLLAVLNHLAKFARHYRALPTLGFTHFQPAQLTTVGKRATLWMQDLLFDTEEVSRRIERLALRGAKGTTGTQASFLSLFHGDHQKVLELDRLVAAKMGFDRTYSVTGQTYPRKVDAQILETLSGIAQSAHKFATDLRLLAHRREIEEPFESEQIGSSAMAYKRNPMRSERICALARFGMNLAANAAQTAAVQWLERTLDDSANRRLVLPQAFLTADAILRLYANVASGLVVNERVIARGVSTELPYLATETILMMGVEAGGDRQHLHERIRQHSLRAQGESKDSGEPSDLVAHLRSDPAFGAIDWERALDPSGYIGRAPEQVDEFLSEIGPLLAQASPDSVDAEVQV